MSESSEKSQRVVIGETKPGVQVGRETGRLGFLRSALNMVFEGRRYSGEHQESSQDLKSRLEKRLENWHVWINQQQLKAESVEKPRTFREELDDLKRFPKEIDSYSLSDSLGEMKRVLWDAAAVYLDLGDKFLTGLRLRLGGPGPSKGQNKG